MNIGFRRAGKRMAPKHLRPAPNRRTNSSSSFVHVLKSESFIEKAFLLILTAVLSGVFVPLVIKSVDAARENRAEIARAQAKLFDEVSETILTLEALALDVSWFGTESARNVELQERAFQRYSERTVDLIARWRAESARAQALASPDVAIKLNDFLRDRFFEEQDTPTTNLWNSCRAKCDWQRQHTRNVRVLCDANGLILELAHDLGLTRPDDTPLIALPKECKEVSPASHEQTQRR